MNVKVMRRIVVVAFVVAAILTGALVARAGGQGGQRHPITVRWCPEDAVHVGRGDFDGTRWTRYVCIARDDL